jgi:hypothetical protein
MIGGSVSIHPAEASSLRTELEQLVALYSLLPRDKGISHVCDNIEAIRTHNNIEHIHDPTRRNWLQTPYHSTIARLH